MKDSNVNKPGRERLAAEVLQEAERSRVKTDNPELSKYFVQVQWADKVPESAAVNQLGPFANQGTVCKPTALKRRHMAKRTEIRFPKRNWVG